MTLNIKRKILKRKFHTKEMRDYRVKTFMQKCVNVFFRRVYSKKEKVETSPKAQEKKLFAGILLSRSFHFPPQILFHPTASYCLYYLFPDTCFESPLKLVCIFSLKVERYLLVPIISLSVDLQPNQFM